MSGLPWYPERKPRPVVTSQIEVEELPPAKDSTRSAVSEIDILWESEPAATWQRFLRNARLADLWDYLK